MEETTLAMVKPDGFQRKLVGECIKRIESAGLEIIDIKITRFDRAKAEEFRKEIKERHPSIYESLIEYMTAGPMIAMIIKGDNAISKLREICGATNPAEAKKGTIRGDHGEGDLKEDYKKGIATRNIIHASGNAQEAQDEIKLIF